MTEFSESLTVRIVGDSRHLDRELGNVVRRLTDFENRLQRVSGFRDLFGGMSRQISALSRPLQGVNQLLGQIGQQLVLLSQYPVTLNVTPALVSLQRSLRAQPKNTTEKTLTSSCKFNSNLRRLRASAA